MTAPGAAIAKRLGALRGRRTTWLLQLLVAGACVGYATGAALGWGSRTVALIMGDFGLSAAALLAAASCFWYARSHAGPFRPAWLLFAGSSSMLGLGNAFWGWYEVVLRRPVPSPSPADFCFLLFAPLAIIGLLVLAKRPVTRAGWMCLGLDAWLIGGSLLTLSWSLALAHATYWQGHSVARAALSLAYPLLDIVLVSMVLALHFRRSTANRSAINTALGALALTVICDALFTSPMLRESYRSGQLLDAGWFAGSMLLACAPWVAGRHDQPSDREERRAPACHGARSPAGRPVGGSLAALAPYLAAAVCTLGVLYNALDERRIDRVVLLIGCTVVLALVVRQGIMLLDNIRLTRELARAESHFRSLVQGSSDVIMIAAPTGVLRYVSPAASGVYGRDAGDLVGSPLSSLIHPDDLGRVLHEVRRFLAAPPDEDPFTRIECRFRHGSGAWLNVESTINRYQGGLIFNSRDVTERVRLQAQLQHNASHDSLTDLPNRALFTERVSQVLSGRRSGDSETAVLFIDLDGFKAVNDTVGHHAGDELLVQAARRLRESVRAGDTAARLGGDEFAALIVGDCPRGHAEDPETGPGGREFRIREIADRLRSTLSQPYLVDGHELRVAASIGVAFAESGITPAGLMRNADLAMYRAKQAGKNRVELYAPQMQADVVRRAELATRLRGPLRDGEFTLLHQPVVELASGRISAVAAQPRWRNPDNPGEAPPTVGEPLSHGRSRHPESVAGPAPESGSPVLKEAVEQAARRRAAGLLAPVAVRLPAQRLMDRALSPSGVQALLTRNRLPSGALILQVADDDPHISLDQLERRLAGLRRLGIVITLDGVGSGCGAIRALRRLPVDALRLDPDLIEGITESPRVRKITAGLLRMSEALGLTSLADGVDRPEQVALLSAMGCSHGQGLAFSGPLDEHQLRGALVRESYPVPVVSDNAAVARAGAEERSGNRSMVVAGALPARCLESYEKLPPWIAAADGSHALIHAPFGSNGETSVPPT